MGDLRSSDDNGSAAALPLREESFLESLSDEEFTLFAELIYKAAGIRLARAKKGLLISRLSRRLRACGCSAFYDYYQKVKHDHAELIEMLNCISTNTTNFFRENYHFDYLKKTVLPPLIAGDGDHAVRIWSAGCSTGEEPYSLAIAAHETFRNLGTDPCSCDLKILATDISTKVLEAAHAGVYEREQIPDGVPEELVGRYFLRGTGEYAGRIKVKDVLRERIRFRRLNLKEETYPLTHPFDVIFCRNVMIYFDENMKRYVLSKFHRHLAEGGYLFLGHSETMFDKDKFTPAFITVYRKS